MSAYSGYHPARQCTKHNMWFFFGPECPTCAVERMKPVRDLPLLFDLDSVIADMLPHWLKAIWKRTGVGAQMEDITRWEMHKCHPLSALQPKDLYADLDDPAFYPPIPVLGGAAYWIPELIKKGYDVKIVTARFRKAAINATIDWLAQHFPTLSVEKNVVFCADKHFHEGALLIDDRLETLVTYGLRWPEAKLATIDYAYNRADADLARFYRSSTTWKEIHDWIVQTLPRGGK